ncbi:MAG TPA: redoxin domain-containing protein [Candidatus Edwardsbacteria bacterium]|nr:redoxin domain-containing protein [Candidatus Edwardsbacteria bacterium]
MKRISSIVWLVLGLSLAGLLVFSWYWFDSESRFSEQSQQIERSSDPALQVTLAQRLLADNANLDKPHKIRVLQYLAMAYSRQGDYRGMIDTYRQALALDPKDPQLYNSIAYEWAERGLELDSADAYAQRAVAMARQQAAQPKPVVIDQAAWDRGNNTVLGNFLDTYGWVLYRKQDYAGAEAQLREAFKRAPDGEIEYHLGLALQRTGKLDEAVEHLMRSLTKDLAHPDSARAAAQQAYVEKNRSRRGFDELLAKYQDQAKLQQQAQELADNAGYIGRPAPDFTLADLGDAKRSLAAARGSVVVVDFWATWCQPCRMALPLVDKVCKQYQGRGVLFYAVDLEEQGKLAQVKKFVADNGYSFTVLRGGKMGTGVDKLYGVNGIPTSFVIDQQGVIRFRHIGYREKLDELLSKELDSLLK